MKDEKYQEYKKFIPLFCKACGTVLDPDIDDDELCQDCIGSSIDADFEDEDYYILEEFEQYLETEHYNSIG